MTLVTQSVTIRFKESKELSVNHRQSEPVPEFSPKSQTQRVIARRLAVGFGSVSVVAIAMCLMLLSLINQVSGLIIDMRGDEAPTKESLSLTMAVREQYMEQVHWIMEQDSKYLATSHRRYEDILEGVRILRPFLPQEEHHRLDSVARHSRALDDLFRQNIQPAVTQGDTPRIAQEHRRAQQISQRATEQADAIARAMDHKMARTHVSATRATRLGLMGGGFFIILIVALSVGHTLRLRRVVLKPLDILSEAARRYGAGDFGHRLGRVGDGELHAVAQAFDGMAEELEVREKRLVASERMAAIGQLAAGVAHEINNPIGIIRGYLKTMGPESTTESLQEELAILDEEAAACQRIAEDLVEYSRAPKLRSENTPMGNLLRETIRRFRESPDCEGVSLEVEAEQGNVFADAGRIRQVVLNLLVNAAQASGSPSEVRVSGRVIQNGGYEVAVEDRGPGVAPEDHGRVFEPFFSRRSGGSGLGLAVCQGIIRSHGGTIHVENREGGGSSFRFTIPDTRKNNKEPS